MFVLVLFLEFKVLSFIYYNLLFKVTKFNIEESMNPTKKDCFADVETSTTNHTFLKL
jgi:hypothetical protein